jgi:hypothetical protein
VKYLKGLKGDTFFFLFLKIHQLVKFFFPKETYGSIWDQMHPNEKKNLKSDECVWLYDKLFTCD